MSWEVTADKPHEFKFVCLFHRPISWFCSQFKCSIRQMDVFQDQVLARSNQPCWKKKKMAKPTNVSTLVQTKFKLSVGFTESLTYLVWGFIMTNKRHQAGMMHIPHKGPGNLGLRDILSLFFQMRKYSGFVVVRAGHVWSKLAQGVAKNGGLPVGGSWSPASPLLAAVYCPLFSLAEAPNLKGYV